LPTRRGADTVSVDALGGARSQQPRRHRARASPLGQLPGFPVRSRARGTAAPNADWDIGIEGPEELPGHVLQRILADLEDLPTLHSFDVVDMTTVSESFRRTAMIQTLPL